MLLEKRWRRHSDPRRVYDMVKEKKERHPRAMIARLLIRAAIIILEIGLAIGHVISRKVVRVVVQETHWTQEVGGGWCNDPCTRYRVTYEYITCTLNFKSINLLTITAG